MTKFVIAINSRRQPPTQHDRQKAVSLPERDTRQSIVDTAERFFRDIGYQKTTVADIAKSLRMSPANVYRFFDSKKSIISSAEGPGMRSHCAISRGCWKRIIAVRMH